jgi:hypothetical protein
MSMYVQKCPLNIESAVVTVRCACIGACVSEIRCICKEEEEKGGGGVCACLMLRLDTSVLVF